MTNSNIVTSAVQHIPTQEDLSATQATGTSYRQLLRAAQQGNKQAQDNLLTRLMQIRSDKQAWQAKAKPWDRRTPSYALEHARALVLQMQTNMRTRSTNPADWEQFEDHGILYRPYMGKFSRYDLISLVTGRQPQEGKYIRGMKGLRFTNTGTLEAIETGYQLELDGKVHLLDAEAAFAFILAFKRESYQAIPYTYNCVMDGHRDSNLTPDGVSVVLPKGLFYEDKNHDKHELLDETRISMKHTHYTWLMHVAAHFRFHQPDPSGRLALMAKIAEACLGELRIPANLFEIEYCHNIHWFDPKPETEKLEYLKPGRSLSGYHLEIYDDKGKVVEPSDFESLAIFTAAYKRVHMARAAETARRAKQKAEQKQSGQTQARQAQILATPEIDPFMPSTEGQDDLGNIDMIDDIP